jgi:DivIVA domain-containing protein
MKLWTEIEGAEFTLAVRGYDREEVDAFLDAAIVGVREVEEENSALHAKVNKLVNELESTRAKSTSVEHAFLEAVEQKQRMLADAERRATEILAAAESHVGKSEAEKEVAGLRSQARLMLEQAREMLAAAEREAASIRLAAAGDGEAAVAAIKAEAEKILAAAESEAAGIVEGAQKQHDRLVAALRLLQDAVREMLVTGAQKHEAIKVVLDATDSTSASQVEDAAIA